MRLGGLAAQLGLILTVAATHGLTDDWPMWRHDPSRSAVSSEDLPEEMQLLWTRQLPPHTPAWPNEPRLDFDVSHEPVVAGQTLFLASVDHGSVTAYDTETGAEIWRSYANGPVRFAPGVWQGKVYFGSDDGYLYCVAAQDGRLIWKVRGCPENRPERYHLGNNRLISFWPVRGGPVIADGAVYFAAGIWPTLGVFVGALDAETGEAIWIDGESNRIENVRLDHNQLHESAVSPQGYLIVQGDLLIVPNGRSLPVRYNRHTGERLYYLQGYRNGACRVTATQRYAFVGNDGVIDLQDGREVGNRWVQAGTDAPERFEAAKLDLFEGPLYPYKLFPACNARSAVGPDGVMYGMHAGVFHAYDTARATTSTYEADRSGRKLNPGCWEAPSLWELPSGHADGSPSGPALIKAGSRLYSHAQNVLIAAETGEGQTEPGIAWERGLDGTPSAMLAANGRLFVVTEQGELHCFGAGDGAAREYALDVEGLPEVDDRWTQTAGDVLQASGIDEGHCLLLGLGSGRLLQELLRQSELRVIAVDPDARLVNATRDRLVAAGLYGSRAEVLVGKPAEFSFPPYLASLVVSENPRRAGIGPAILAERLAGMLRPYGGTACLPLPQDAQRTFEEGIKSAAAPNVSAERSDRFLLVRRKGALPGSAPWTHESADPARTYFSRDELVDDPLGVLWYGDGEGYGFYKHKDYGTGVKPQVIGGRLFALQVFSQTLHAVDVYTGRLLWKTKVEPFTRYASMEDGIYVAGKDQCVVHDPATGAVLRTVRYETPGGGSPAVSDIRVGEDVVVIAAAFEKVRVIEEGLWDSTILVALDRETGEQLWTREAEERFNNHALALGPGTVFCVDSLSGVASEKLKRRGEVPETAASTILALDSRTGDERWRRVHTNPFRTYSLGSWLGVRANDDWTAYCGEANVLLAGKGNQVYALQPGTGEEIWHKTIGGGQPMVIEGDAFMTQALQRHDLRTGEPLGEAPSLARGGCNYAVAGQSLIFLRNWCVSYFDRDTQEKHYLRNIRSGCSNSLVAADGLLNAPCFSVRCVCNYPIQTSFAMVHMPEVAQWDARPAG